MSFNKEQKQDYIQQAIYCLNEEKMNDAKRLLDQLLKLDIEDMEIHFLYGVYHVKKGNFRSAISNFLRVLDSSYSTIYMPQAVKILVYCYTKTKNMDLAIHLIKDALDKYYQDPQLKNMLAYALCEQGNYKEAVQTYAEIIKTEPENVTALNGLGYCLIEYFARHQEGLDFCQKALKLSPDDPAILDSVGWGYYKLGQYKEAELYLKQAFEVLPEDETIKKHIMTAVEAG